MPDLNDTYVVHCATCTCSMGMRGSVAVLSLTHGVFLRGIPQMTVKDSKKQNLVCFGGCYSMENPSTQEEAAKIQAQIEEECPDTFLDKAINFFTGGKKEAKQNDVSNLEEGQMAVLGECLLNIIGGQEWSDGKDIVDLKGAKPLMGGAKLYCMYGGEIEIIEAGQPEEGSGSQIVSNSVPISKAANEANDDDESRNTDKNIAENSETEISVNGASYTEGKPVKPEVEFDNDFPYDPNFNPTKEDYKNWLEWQVNLLGAQTLGYLPDGCKTYKHYTQGLGEDLQIDYEKAYRQDANVKKDVDLKLNEGITAALAYYNTYKKDEFSLSGGPTTTPYYPTTENWQKAIGGHTQWNSMDVTVSNNEMIVVIVVHELDRYNFDKNKADLGTGTLDEVNGRFASAGWAHEFTTEGTVERMIIIDLDEDLDNLNLESDGVNIASKRNTQYGTPWEGKER